MKLVSMLSIRTKLTSLIMLLIAGISVFIYLYFPGKIARHQFAAIAGKAQTIAEMTAYSLSPALLFEDPGAADEALNSARQNSDLAYIIVFDAAGRVFCSYDETGVRHEHGGAAPGDSSAAVDPRVFEQVTSIIHNGKVIGQLHLGISLNDMNAEISRSRETIGLVSVLVFVWGAISVFLIGIVLTRPLNSMVDTVERITRGDLTRRAVVSSDDEVGRLAAAFNRMVGTLHTTRVDLETVNRTLEERVLARTRELQEEVDEKKRKERELYMSEQRYRNLVDTMHEFVTEVAADGKLLFLNRTLADSTGYTIGELTGTDFFGHVHPDDRSVVRQQCRVLKGGEQALRNAEFRFRKKDGTYLALSSNADPIIHAGGGSRSALLVSFDITERIRAEEQIREQAALLDVARDAILLRGLDHRILFWSKGAENLYGWSAAEVLGRDARELLDGQDPAAAEAFAATTVKGAWIGEFRHRQKDGAGIVVESRWSLVRTSAGEAKSILVVNSDISDKKRLETQFRRAQRLEIIGTLAGGIAHDLNNVLSPILMAIQLLESKADDEKSKSWLGLLESSTKRGADIVKQVLTFARGIEGERIALRPCDLIREMEEIVQETFPRAIHISTEAADDGPSVVGDATQLHQVLMNLCVNARDAMQGGGQLMIAAENIVLDERGARLHLEARPGPYVVLSVSDTGTGIAPDIIEKIFDPFFSTKEIGKGTGLGLPTVLTIVRSHGGFVTVQSEEGKGTTFRCFLPAVDGSPAALPAVELRGLPAGRGETILLVDDEAPIREITQEILEACGYCVIAAEDGSAALGAYEKSGSVVELVLTDMMMPRMDGASLIRELGRLDPELKIIAASGLADFETIPELRAPNVQAFLPKPFKSETLLSTIQSVLRSPGRAGRAASRHN